MEYSASVSPTGSATLEGLGKERVLGEAANLGCPGFATPYAIKTTVRECAVAAVPTAVKSGQSTAVAKKPKCG